MPDYKFPSRRRSSISTRSRSGRSSASCRRSCAATSSSSAGSRSTSPARCRRRTRSSAFVADNDPDKRDKLIDGLLETPEYSYYFANKWADILRVKRAQPEPDRAHGTFAFHDWIREAIAADKPYDEFARDILAATGDETDSPADGLVQGPAEARAVRGRHGPGVPRPAPGLRPVPPPSLREVEPGRLLGPGRLLRPARPQEPARCPARSRTSRTQPQSSSPARRGTVTNKRTGQPAVMKPLDGEPMKVAATTIRGRSWWTGWSTPKNPFFARAVANRYWAHFFGRGIVDPLDDMRVTNPPTQSRAARRPGQGPGRPQVQPQAPDPAPSARAGRTSSAAMPNEFNKHDKQTYARYYPQRHDAPRCCSTRSAR